MNNRISKEDRLVSGIMKDFRVESPPAGFREKVMQSIQQEKSYSALSSQPLISKGGWIGIAAGLSILIVLIFIGNGSEVPGDTGYFGQILSSLSFPEIKYSFSRLFNWNIFDSPTLFWISTGVGGILLMAFLERLLHRIRIRFFFLI
jgi:hypothetical protein